MVFKRVKDCHNTMDFRELARIMREYDAHPLLIREVADFCSSENSRFERSLFYVASGLSID